jgi:hypothetical protein
MAPVILSAKEPAMDENEFPCLSCSSTDDCTSFYCFFKKFRMDTKEC